MKADPDIAALPPSWTRAILFGLAYFLSAAATVRFTRFEGGAAYLWVSSAILIPEFCRLAPRHWGRPIATCALGSFVATALFGVGPVHGPPLTLFLIAEAAIAAWLLRRGTRNVRTLGSLGALGFFALVTGVIAPALSGVGGAAVISLATGVGYWHNFLHWFGGHALGNIAVAPILMLLMTGESGRRPADTGWRRRAEAVALVVVMTAVSFSVFAQAKVPLLFLPLLPMMIAAFRFGRLGASVSVAILAAVGGMLTLRGFGPINMIDALPGIRAVYFQLYLAVVVLTILPAAAELSHRQALFAALRESEARYRLIADQSSDVILSFAIDGKIQYVSPSVAELSGYSPAELIGGSARKLVVAEDWPNVVDSNQRAIANQTATTIVEYRVLRADGAIRWCESHARSVIDESGRVVGTVTSVRDISHHKTMAEHLERVASTDALTGLVNRRAFDAALARRIDEVRAGTGQGCCAILDLDFFKLINDRHGHAAGDKVLRVFADIAARSLRDADLIARLGGEEFGLILWGAGIDEAQQVCERLRRQVADLSVAIGTGVPIRFTVSGGLAAIDGHKSAAAVLRDADEALYRAKAAGRNRLAA